jgi:hypothetical protein
MLGNEGQFANTYDASSWSSLESWKYSTFDDWLYLAGGRLGLLPLPCSAASSSVDKSVCSTARASFCLADLKFSEI